MTAGKVDTAAHARRQPVLHRARRPAASADALERVPLRVHLGLYDDETSERCHWHVPEAHSLETWSDARAYDGTVTILQPLIAPLYGGKSAHEVLAAFTAARRAAPATTSCASTGRRGSRRRRLRARLAPRAARRRRRGHARSPRRPWRVQARATGLAAPRQPAPSRGSSSSFRARPDRRRRPLRQQRLAAGAAQAAHQADLGQRGADEPRHGDEPGVSSTSNSRPVESGGEPTPQGRHRRGGAEVRRPSVRARPGSCPAMPTASSRVHLGYGRTRAGRVGNGVGFNAYACPHRARRRGARPGASVDEDRRARDALASTQDHWSDGRAANTRSVRATPRGVRAEPRVRSQEMGEDPPQRPDAVPAASRTRATPGAWRSTSTPASAATPA